MIWIFYWQIIYLIFIQQKHKKLWPSLYSWTDLNYFWTIFSYLKDYSPQLVYNICHMYDHESMSCIATVSSIFPCVLGICIAIDDSVLPFLFYLFNNLTVALSQMTLYSNSVVFTLCPSCVDYHSLSIFIFHFVYKIICFLWYCHNA